MLVYLVNNGAYKIEASGLHKENKTCKLDYGKKKHDGGKVRVESWERT
jgi:hypothetical protein